MSKNQYKQATKYFGIPVPGWKDNIWPELELLKWQMIENMLIAAMRGNINAVFREGNSMIMQEGDGSFIVKFLATGNEPAIQGSVGGAYFEALSIFQWTNLKAGSFYYLYVQGNNNTFQDAKDVCAVASTTRLSTSYVTLVATADLTQESPVIDRNPVGKINARDLGQHVLDFDNPHGDKVVQDEILVRNRLAIGEDNDAVIDIDVNGKLYNVPVSKVVESLKTKQVFVDFVSEGWTGAKICGEGTVKFVSIMQLENFSVSNEGVYFGVYGKDPEVKSKDEVIVRTGSSGVAMRAMLTCEVEL